MKLTIQCPHCIFAKEGPKDISPHFVEVADNGVYSVVCRLGHRTVVLSWDQKYEVLFEIALNAIVEGYFREAIASAASSLERFYEWMTRVICHVRSVPVEAVETTWKHAANQSERQLGMFLSACLIGLNEVPELLPDHQISLRNRVVHKGRIPTREEAIKFLVCVIGVIAPLRIRVYAEFRDSIASYHQQAYDQLHLLHKGPSTLTLGSSPTLGMASRDDADGHEEIVERRLKEISLKRRGLS